jgi:uncharacterized membrane protein
MNSSVRPPSPSVRVAFVDLLRGWAVIVMIQTHVFNATMIPALTETGIYSVIRFLDGLVAPSFLFASGLAYAITTRRKIGDYLSFGWPLFRQFGRLIFILLIGYSLHIPKFNYHHLVNEATHEAWMAFWQADVLHCIAVSLIALQVLLLLCRSERRLYQAVLVLTGAVVVGAPIMWSVDWWLIFPPPIAAYLNGQHYSLFPLFPWSAFLFAGALTGYYFTRARSSQAEGAESRMMRSVARAGLAVIAGSFALHPLAAAAYPAYDYWRSSPSFFLLRAGLVMLLCSGLFLYEQRKGADPASAVTLFGRESFVVYVTHLMLIYGKFGPNSFTQIVGQSFGYLEASFMTLLVLLLMFALAHGWARVRREPPRTKRTIELVVLAGFLLVFFFWPFGS